MACRSFSLAVGLVLAGICAPLMTSVRAGDRIEFSAPLVPLAIPQQEVETKQQPTAKLFPGVIPAGNLGGEEYISSGQVTFRQVSKVEKDPWYKDPWSKDQWNTDPFKNKYDYLPNGTSEQNAATNALKLLGLRNDQDAQPQASMLLRNRDDSQDSQNGQNNSRFDQTDKTDQLDRGGVFGRDASEQRDYTASTASSFFRALTRNPQASRFNAGAFIAFDHPSASLTGDSPASDWQSSQGPQQSANDPNRLGLPPEFANFHPPDQRPGGDATPAASSYIHAWDDVTATHTASASAARNRFSDQINPSRVVAPNRPANLPWVKRPGDPNPF